MPRDQSALSIEEEYERFLYHVTHDLKACFRALKVLPSWVREDLSRPGGGEEIESHLEMMEIQARRGDRMLADLREYSRVGRTSGPPERLLLIDCVDHARASLDLPEAFEVVVTGGDLTLNAPEEDLHRLFVALIGNAVKHHDQTSGQITISGLLSQGKTTIRIYDDGPGIPVEFHDRVFGVLTTLASRDNLEGSGMGLAIAQKVMRLAGGTITIAADNSPRGTTFVLSFPSRSMEQPQTHLRSVAR